MSAQDIIYNHAPCPHCGAVHAAQHDLSCRLNQRMGEFVLACNIWPLDGRYRARAVLTSLLCDMAAAPASRGRE